MWGRASARPVGLKPDTTLPLYDVGTGFSPSRRAKARHHIGSLLESRTQPLDLATPLLLLQAPAFLGFRRARRLAFRPFAQRVAEQLFHSGERAVAIGALAAFDLRCHSQDALAIDPAREPLSDALFLLIVQRQCVDVHLDRHPRLDLLDVL